MYDPTQDLQTFANQQVLPTVTVGGDAPWANVLANALASVGSAAASTYLQGQEIDNAYKLAALQRGIYSSPGGAYSGPTPWLGVTGPAPGGVPVSAGMPFGGVDPLMLVLAVAVIGIGAVFVLRK